MEPSNHWVVEENRPPKVHVRFHVGLFPGAGAGMQSSIGSTLSEFSTLLDTTGHLRPVHPSPFHS